MLNTRERKQGNTFKLFGALFGLCIFFGSFYVLWSNEGRVNFGEVAQESLLIDGSSLAPGSEGILVAVTGDLTSTESLDDPLFLEPKAYIQLNRTVEMYAWEEKEINEDDETYYEYTAGWTEFPEDSVDFYDTSYVNPTLPFESESFVVNEAKVGVYQIDPRAVEYPEAKVLDLFQETLISDIEGNQDITNTGKYIYVGFNSIDTPEIGDLRVSFSTVPQTKNMTVFGQINGEHILPYPINDDDALYRLFFVNRESAILVMEEEYEQALWSARIGGFAMLWCGMFLVLNPITILVSFLPILRKTGSWILLFLTLPISAIIATGVILASFFAHNLWVLIGIVALAIAVLGGIAGLIWYLDKQKQQQA